MFKGNQQRWILDTLTAQGLQCFLTYEARTSVHLKTGGSAGSPSRHARSTESGNAKPGTDSAKARACTRSAQVMSACPLWCSA
jgi:hypothetical protein